MANFIKSAIKHPGRVKRFAARKGISTSEAASEMAHSGNKSERGAGILAERFQHGDLHHGKKKHVFSKLTGR